MSEVYRDGPSFIVNASTLLAYAIVPVCGRDCSPHVREGTSELVFLAHEHSHSVGSPYSARIV